MASDLATVQKNIDAMHEKVQRLNYYELFNIHEEMDAVAFKTHVNNQFRNLVRQWHIDRFNNYDLGARRDKVQQIFKTLNMAHQTLLNDEKRAQYDFEISGNNQDVQSILDAEQAFRKGQSLLDMGSYKGAYERFKIATEGNPDDLEYRAHCLFCEFLMMPANSEGAPKSRRRVKEIFDELNHISATYNDHDWILYFLGVVAKGMGDLQKAERLFHLAVQNNHMNHAAKRELRIIKMRKGSSGKQNFFSQIMDKFRK